MDISSTSSAGFGLSLVAVCPFERLAEITCLRGTHSQPLGPGSWCSPMRSSALGRICERPKLGRARHQTLREGYKLR
jgi:hypothetical protein